MLETYEAYADYLDVAAMTEQLVAHVARRGARDDHGRDRRRDVDLSPPWRRVTLRDAIPSGPASTSRPRRARVAGGGDGGRAASSYRRTGGWGKLVDELLSKHVEPKLIEPDVRARLPRRAVAVRKPHRDEPGAGRALRGVRRRHGDRQRVQRAERPRRAARALRAAAAAAAAPETRRRSRSTRTSSRRSSTACRRPAASGSASTAW